jgi:diguanylate cyclase (GGDEF)-like protein
MTEDARATLLRILDGLKKTAEGNMLFTFIARGVAKFEGTALNNAFLDFTDRLLVRYLSNPDADPATRVRVKMIQSRLRLYRGEETASTPAPVVSAPVPAPEPAPAPESRAMQIAKRMDQALAQGQSLDELLRSSIDALDTGNDPGLAALREQLKRGVEELLGDQKQLQQQLTTTRSEMRALDDDKRELEARLNKVREHSLTDELTGLPNREQFLKQLEAEVGRARRYGFSLAVALLDIDNLRGVNKRYGNAAGDAVLSTYAAEIVSQFRGYDLVARYGGDEFAVLLPNTQKDGASRAVDKARKLASSTYIDIEGASIPLPTFSSVLTLYAHGEAPATLLKRADDALMRAKHKGAAQSVVALPPR